MGADEYYALKRGPRTFEAKYRGRCSGCGEAIESGETVRYEDDELVHEDCDLTPSADEATTETCPPLLPRGRCEWGVRL